MNENNKVIKTVCPECGSNEFEFDDGAAKLICKFCGYKLEDEKFNESVDNLDTLSGTKVSSGANDLDKSDVKSLIVIHCSNCGAEVIAKSGEEYVRCHWCRTVLSSTEVIEKLRVPDQVLPFKVSKEKAKDTMFDFILKRLKYAIEKIKMSDLSETQKKEIFLEINKKELNDIKIRRKKLTIREYESLNIKPKLLE